MSFFHVTEICGLGWALHMLPLMANKPPQINKPPQERCKHAAKVQIKTQPHRLWRRKTRLLRFMIKMQTNKK